MQIQILFDSQVVKESLNAGWGISCLIDGRTLFDTGEKGDQLLGNIIELKIDLARLEEVARLKG